MDQFSDYRNSNLSFDQKINIALQFNNLSPSTKDVLTKVYATLACSIVSASIGCVASYIGYKINFLLGIVLNLGTLYAFMTTDMRNFQKKFSLLMAFTFLVGLSIGPLVSYYINMDPSIVLSAFMTTSALFISFSVFSLLTDKRTFLYLGGTLFSMSILVLIAAIFNLFVQSSGLNIVLMGVILMLEIGFVIYDTQLIVYKIENFGHRDFFVHALVLFFDFIDIFKLLLKILAAKKKKRDD